MVVAVLWVKVAELIPGPAAMSTAIMKGRLVVTAEGRGEGMQQRDAGDGLQEDSSNTPSKSPAMSSRAKGCSMSARALSSSPAASSVAFSCDKEVARSDKQQNGGESEGTRPNLGLRDANIEPSVFREANVGEGTLDRPLLIGGDC